MTNTINLLCSIILNMYKCAGFIITTLVTIN